MKKTTDTPAGEESAALRDRVWDVLIPARAGYLARVSPHYDEVFHDVAQRTERAGILSKTDIAALVVRKRLSAQTRWVSALMSLLDAQVRSVTERAVTAVRDTTLPRSEATRTGRGIIYEPRNHSSMGTDPAQLRRAGLPVPQAGLSLPSVRVGSVVFVDRSEAAYKRVRHHGPIEDHRAGDCADGASGPNSRNWSAGVAGNPVEEFDGLVTLVSGVEAGGGTTDHSGAHTRLC
jgi:hypothetical protein